MNICIAMYNKFKSIQVCFFLCLGILNSNIIRAQTEDPEKTDKKQFSEAEVIGFGVAKLALKIQNKEITSQEVTRIYLDRIDRYNKTLNAIVTVNRKKVLADAIKADQELANGKIRGPLHGVPVTIKDSFETRGLRTTSGHEPLKNHIPEQDASVVEKLRHAGVVILGKTNLPELAMDVQTSNRIFGRTNNPWNNNYSVGGSSGGAGAALAAGLTALDIGSDIGGSIRIPSGFNGVYGIKPTDRIVSGAGHIPELPDQTHGVYHMASFGPMARSIKDLELVLPLVAGGSSRDRTISSFLKPVDSSQSFKMRIAWNNQFANVRAEAGIREAMKAFMIKLQKTGFQFTKSAPSDFDYNLAWQTYGEILGMETGFKESNFFRTLFNWLQGCLVTSEPVTDRFFEPMSVEKYFIALNKRDVFIHRLEEFLKDYDAWIVPVTTTAAHKHIEPERYVGPVPLYDSQIRVDNKELPYFTANMSFTTIFNLTGHPVVVIPIALSKDGLPIGIQIVGRRGMDMQLLQLAQKLDANTTPIGSPPDYRY